MTTIPSINMEALIQRMRYASTTATRPTPNTASLTCIVGEDDCGYCFNVVRDETREGDAYYFCCGNSTLAIAADAAFEKAFSESFFNAQGRSHVKCGHIIKLINACVEGERL